MRSLLAALLLALPGLAHAGPITAGASLGLTQEEAMSAQSPDHSQSVFGRLALTPRLAAQLEVARIDVSDRMQNADVKTVDALAVLDLGASGHLVPILLAGAGLDRASATYGDVAAHHLEAGLGLEYRADGGLVIGADARIGDRTIDSDTTLVPDLWWNPLLQGGQYRSARVTLGVRF
ncbi:MAG: hypothetical protein ACM31C_03755 [Acidobacteriota bacterium]